MDFPSTCKRLANACKRLAKAGSQSVLHTTEEARSENAGKLDPEKYWSAWAFVAMLESVETLLSCPDVLL